MSTQKHILRILRKDLIYCLRNICCTLSSTLTTIFSTTAVTMNTSSTPNPSMSLMNTKKCWKSHKDCQLLQTTLFTSIRTMKSIS